MADINKIAKEMADSYTESDITVFSKDLCLPNRDEVISVINLTKKLFFPAYFDSGEIISDAVAFAGTLLIEIEEKLKNQLLLALSFKDKKADEDSAEAIKDLFISELPNVHKMLIMDAHATFEGDPAAQSLEEVIFSYPGFYAIFVYRLAHILHLNNVPFIPRMMSEYAHSKTGIDINPGAKIGKYFFIDHGTGIVIGETTIIGDRVKLYQGVTLGALSPRKGQILSGKKRHPTVKNNVTIYSGASILGGDTIIGEGAVIGGNSFITESVPDYSKVSAKLPELIINRTK